LPQGGAILSCADAVAKALEAYNREKMSPELFGGKQSIDIFPSSEGSQYVHDSNANLMGACPRNARNVAKCWLFQKAVLSATAVDILSVLK
jgi:hypothetical protein